MIIVIIVFKRAVALALAGEASAARLYLLVGQLYQFGFDACVVEFLEHLTNQNRCVAVLTGASVDADYFHTDSFCIAIPKKISSLHGRTSWG